EINPREAAPHVTQVRRQSSHRVIARNTTLPEEPPHTEWKSRRNPMWDVGGQTFRINWPASQETSSAPADDREWPLDNLMSLWYYVSWVIVRVVPGAPIFRLAFF